jgi:hypothetical protein
VLHKQLINSFRMSISKPVENGRLKGKCELEEAISHCSWVSNRG